MTDESLDRVNDLLARAQAGEGQQRDALFEACRSYLGVLARAQVESWLQAKVDASDLVQQTLLEAHRDFDRFTGRTGGEWLAWLRRMLTHNAADFVRHYRGTEKRQARREVALGARGDAAESQPAWEPAADDPSPSQQVLAQDEELELAAAVASLAPDHAEVIMLRNLQRLPFDEVARRMNRSRPAAQMLWMRAMKQLERKLRPADAPGADA
ncbi:MAG: sigma-70 family RNA polymerase sigma factor [Pirellulales bacterium]|nr:sigma-70 family RNA polymerase sigma factor [Pirellulales bacterium]